MDTVTRKEGHDPVRTFRAGDEWDKAREIAKARGETLSHDVLRPALTRYIKRYGGDEHA